MRAITVRQPWAWAIVHGGKDVENRTRNIAGAYRGPVAVHAGCAFDDVMPRSLEPVVHVFAESRHYERGAVVGVVDLVDVHRGPDRGPEPVRGCWRPADVLGWTPLVENDEYARCSAWGMADHHHLVLANPRPLPRPIPWRGQLGLWTVPADLEAAIREQVDL